MKCRKIHNQYLDYLEGNLDKESNKNIEVHLKVCDHCRQFVEKLKVTLQFIDTEKSIAPDPFMFTRIQAKLGETDKNIRINKLKIVFQAAAAAVLILISIYAGKIIGQGYSDKTTLESDYNTEVYYLYDVQNQLINSDLLLSNYD